MSKKDDKDSSYEVSLYNSNYQDYNVPQINIGGRHSLEFAESGGVDLETLQMNTNMSQLMGSLEMSQDDGTK